MKISPVFAVLGIGLCAVGLAFSPMFDRNGIALVYALAGMTFGAGLLCIVRALLPSA